MTRPDDIPTGDLYDDASDYFGGWQAIQVDVTERRRVGTLFVVRDGVEERWDLLDRRPIEGGPLWACVTK